MAAAAALAVLVAADGCGSSGSGSATTGAPVAGGTLTFATDTEPGCLDPGYDPLDVTALIDRNIVDSLVYQAPGGSLHPWLAQRWTVSPDGRTYTFTLRPGVRFQDGTPLSAAAVKATLDHAVAPATKSLYAAGLLRTYTGSDVLDARTVAVRLSRPDATILRALSTPYLGIQSPRSLAGPEPALCLHPVGTGPFSFVSWAKTQRLTLRKNPDYRWGPAVAGALAGPAHLDGITVEFIAEDASRIGALTSGQVDVVADVPPVSARAARGADYRLLSAQAPGGVYALYLNTSRGPLADERVRRALAQGVDLTALVRSVYFGQYARSWSVLSPTTADYDPKLTGTWPYDPALAGRLLDQAGWTGRDAQGYRTRNGQRLTIFWPYPSQYLREQRDVLGQGIQAGAKKIGIDIRFVGQDAGTFSREVSSRTADIVSVSTERADPDVLRLLFGSAETYSRGGYNVFGLNDPALDRWLNEAAAVNDPAVRVRDYADAQAYISQHALAVPVYVPTFLLGAASRVHGLTFDAEGAPDLARAWLDT